LPPTILTANSWNDYLAVPKVGRKMVFRFQECRPRTNYCLSSNRKIRDAYGSVTERLAENICWHPRMLAKLWRLARYSGLLGSPLSNHRSMLEEPLANSSKYLETRCRQSGRKALEAKNEDK
jgi:hypothetical protein